MHGKYQGFSATWSEIITSALTVTCGSEFVEMTLVAHIVSITTSWYGRRRLVSAKTQSGGGAAGRDRCFFPPHHSGWCFRPRRSCGGGNTAHTSKLRSLRAGPLVFLLLTLTDLPLQSPLHPLAPGSPLPAPRRVSG